MRELTEISPHLLPWQQPLMQHIVAAQRQQRLPQGIYLHADDGVDVAAFVLYLGQMLCCENAPELSPCGQCSSCSSWQKHQYPNLHWLGIEYDEKRKKYRKDISVDQMRTLIQRLQQTAHSKGLKLAIIYPAHKLNRAAANSFLKTLEEAPDETLVILAGHQRAALPITLLSRCQVWHLPRPDMATAMSWIADQKLEFDVSAADLQRAGGQPERLLQWHHEGYLALQQHFTEQARAYLKGQISAVELAEMLQKLPIPQSREFVLHLLDELIRHQLGVSEKNRSAKPSRSKAAQLFKLKTESQRWLQAEDNNLNIQFQIEDVLLSMNSILIQRGN